jgi:quercetin dioxygenase-like cupin family protein
MTKQLACLLTGCLILAAGQSIRAEVSPGNFETVAPESLDWVLIPDGLGAEYAVVFGDPGKAGTYVIRVRFPAGVMDLPHSHSADRHVTVLEGTWHAGTGLEFDAVSAVPLRAGSYMFHPAGGIHWDGAAGDEDTVVQIIGNGPVETRQEHAEGADWVRVKQSISASSQ